MRTHHIIAEKLLQAQQRRSCLFASNEAESKALRRRTAAGELISPHRGMFIDAQYWNTLNGSEKALHIARGLSGRHPSWTFAGPTAAAVHGFEHQWSIHRSGLYIASQTSSGRSPGGVNRIYMTSIPVANVRGMQVTSQARTLVDCGLTLPFINALPIFDSAFRNGTSEDDVLLICTQLRRDVEPIRRLLAHADPASENGGESLARAVMLEERFALPRLQHVFVNPKNPGQWYRVDFVWFFPGGYTVVAEYDGTAKYVDPSMTDRQTIQAVVSRQGERERNLYSWGVSHIFRFTYDDVIRRQPLTDKLIKAQIPRAG